MRLPAEDNGGRIICTMMMLVILMSSGPGTRRTMSPVGLTMMVMTKNTDQRAKRDGGVRRRSGMNRRGTRAGRKGTEVPEETRDIRGSMRTSGAMGGTKKTGSGIAIRTTAGAGMRGWRPETKREIMMSMLVTGIVIMMEGGGTVKGHHMTETERNTTPGGGKGEGKGRRGQAVAAITIVRDEERARLEMIGGEANTAMGTMAKGERGRESAFNPCMTTGVSLLGILQVVWGCGLVLGRAKMASRGRFPCAAIVAQQFHVDRACACAMYTCV